MAEYFIRICGGCCRTCDCFGKVNIVVVICRSTGSFGSRIIFENDSLGADQSAAPLCIEIKDTDCIRILRINLLLGIQSAQGADNYVIQNEEIKVVVLGELFICEPAYEIIVDTLAADITDLLTVFYPELFSL